MSRVLSSLVIFGCFIIPIIASAQTPAKPLLPANFGAWQVTAPPVVHKGADASALDPGHAAALREDGIVASASADYGAHAGNVHVNVYQFRDATGAYAAFTLYRTAQMRPVKVASDAAMQGGHYLILNVAVVADVNYPDTAAGQLQARAADLQLLAAALPTLRGVDATPPPLPGYLPASGLDPATIHYAIGPAGYAASGSPLPGAVIDFSRDAEVVTAQYASHAGHGLLTVLTYPTPQMASARARAIDALVKGGAAPFSAGDPALQLAHSGPLVAFTSGGFTADEARALAAKVHYNATVTVNHPEGYISEVAKTAKILVSIVSLIGILAVAAVLLAIFLGFGRVAYRRMRGLPDSSLLDDDFISLKIGE